MIGKATSQLDRFITEKQYLPVFLEITDRLCLVVGVGKDALKRASELLSYGSRVHLVAPNLTSLPCELQSNSNFRYSNRMPTEKDVAESYVIIGSDEKNGDDQPIRFQDLEQLKEMADRHGRLFTAIEYRDLGHFTNPAVSRNGPLTVAVSTDGTAPVLGRFIREKIRSEILTDDMANFARFIGPYRHRIRSLISDGERRNQFYVNLIQSDFSLFLSENSNEEALSELIRRVSEFRKYNP